MHYYSISTQVTKKIKCSLLDFQISLALKFIVERKYLNRKSEFNDLASFFQEFEILCQFSINYKYLHMHTCCIFS